MSRVSHIKSAVIRYGGPSGLVDGREVKSGDDGLFRIGRIATKRRDLVIAQAEGYAPAFMEATPGKDKEIPQLDFTMMKGLVVEGQLVDRSGHPVAEASISPRWKMNRQTEYVGNRTAVDKNGLFRLKNLPANGNSLDAYGRGISPVRGFDFDPTKPLVVTMDRPGFIIGRVLDKETQQPITKFNVRLGFPEEPRPPDEPSASFPSHLSDRGHDCLAKDGVFVIEDLITRAGHSVRIFADGYLVGHVDKIVAQPKDPKDWPYTFYLERGYPVSGQLTDVQTGLPVAGARLLIDPDGRGSPRA